MLVPVILMLCPPGTVDEAEEADALFDDGGIRALKEEETGARHNRALCLNQECCASLASGPPSCVPGGTCKVIHEYYLAKNGGDEQRRTSSQLVGGYQLLYLRACPRYQ